MTESKGACFKFKNQMFPVCIQLFAVQMYYGLVFQQYMIDPKATNYPVASIIFLIFIHLFLLMTTWAYFTTYFMDPGKPPVFWGFYLDDPEQKRRRYCLICHIFKPERCHHCSACNRCVLNMDHHCPWLYTCVGYYNRKFFMQLLLYTWLTVLTIIQGSIHHTYTLISDIGWMKNSTWDEVKNKLNIRVEITFQICLITLIIFFFIITIFFKFHIELVNSNSTTIEHLEAKRSPNAAALDQYDVGFKYNWIQVFGLNKVLWFVPQVQESGRPCGDGVVFPSKNSRMTGSQYYLQLNEN